jgi:hypothetical protein
MAMACLLTSTGQQLVAWVYALAGEQLWQVLLVACCLTAARLAVELKKSVSQARSAEHQPAQATARPNADKRHPS